MLSHLKTKKANIETLKLWYEPVQWLLHLPKWSLGPCWLSLILLRLTLLPLLPRPPKMRSQDDWGDWNDQEDQGDQWDQGEKGGQRIIELNIDLGSRWIPVKITQKFDVRMIGLIRMQCEERKVKRMIRLIRREEIEKRTCCKWANLTASRQESMWQKVKVMAKLLTAILDRTRAQF